MIDSEKSRRQFLELYNSLRNLFSSIGAECPYGAESKYGGGDYWIVDDFQIRRHKIYIWKWNIFSADLVRRIRSMLTRDFREWEVTIAFDTAEMTELTPPMGMTLRNDSLEICIDPAYLPPELREFDFRNLETQTKPL